MAAKKDKSGIEALRADVKALQESFWQFRDGMLTDAALRQAEQQQSMVAIESAELPNISDADLTEAASLMAAVGHPQRLRMMILLVNAPVSVNRLVEQLGLGTTGAAYHHLKVLMNQGLVDQPQRGTFGLSANATPKVHQLLLGLFGSSPSTKDDSGKSSKKKKR